MTAPDIVHSLARQLAASLQMLDTALSTATDSVWTDQLHGSPPFWQIAFHTVFYADFYLSTFDPNLDKPDENYVLPEQIQKYAGSHRFNSTPAQVVTQQELDEYLSSTWERLRTYFGHTSDDTGGLTSQVLNQLDDPSGFPWLPMTKYELILYNIRHVMEHVAVLNQYLKASGLDAAGWVGQADL